MITSNPIKTIVVCRLWCLLILFSALVFIHCTNGKDDPKLIPCSFNGPSVFGRCFVSADLCVEFHDGGVGHDVCNLTLGGTWEGAEVCPSQNVTGKCHVVQDLAQNEEWVVFYYLDQDESNRGDCESNNGNFCDF